MDLQNGFQEGLRRFSANLWVLPPLRSDLACGGGFGYHDSVDHAVNERMCVLDADKATVLRADERGNHLCGDIHQNSVKVHEGGRKAGAATADS